MIDYNIFNALPYMAKGRWFAFTLSSDGTDHTIEKSDGNIGSISGDFIKLPAGFHVIDAKYDITFVPNATASTMDHCTKNYADGSQAVPIPAPAKYTEAVVWVFANYVPLS